jgi:hypothetical protein
MRLGAAGKPQGKIITAVARELLGFIWAIGIRAEAIAGQQAAACQDLPKNKTFPDKEKAKTVHR